MVVILLFFVNNPTPTLMRYDNVEQQIPCRILNRRLLNRSDGLILQSCGELPQNCPDLHLVHMFSAVSLEAEHRPVPEQHSGCESIVGCHGVQGILELMFADLLGATLAK